MSGVADRDSKTIFHQVRTVFRKHGRQSRRPQDGEPPAPGRMGWKISYLDRCLPAACSEAHSAWSGTNHGHRKYGSVKCMLRGHVDGDGQVDGSVIWHDGVAQVARDP